MHLAKAAVIKKPRHAVWLRQAVFSEAYFSKYTDWSYEQECRLVDSSKSTENIEGNEILFVPLGCLTAIIVGKNFPQEKFALSKELAKDHSLDWFKLEIGKSYTVPYLIRQSGEVCVFNDEEIETAEHSCSECWEPLYEPNDLCPWCSITENHKHAAAMGNPFRMLDAHGILDSYLQDVSAIERNREN